MGRGKIPEKRGYGSYSKTINLKLQIQGIIDTKRDNQKEYKQNF